MFDQGKPDQDGRYPVTAREMEALRQIYGTSNRWREYHKYLEKRLRMIPNGWRDMKCIIAMCDRLIDKIMPTVPNDKLRIMQTELRHTEVYTRVVGPGIKPEEKYKYLPEKALVKLIACGMETRCFYCMKSQKEARHDCRMYKAIMACYPNEFNESEECPFNGMATLWNEKYDD